MAVSYFVVNNYGQRLKLVSSTAEKSMFFVQILLIFRTIQESEEKMQESGSFCGLSVFIWHPSVQLITTGNSYFSLKCLPIPACSTLFGQHIVCSVNDLRKDDKLLRVRTLSRDKELSEILNLSDKHKTTEI